DRVQRDHVGVVLELLGEAVCQAREAAYLHPHGEVASLDVGRADVVDVGIAGDGADGGPDALSRTVAALWAFWRRAVVLHQPRIVDLATERALYRVEVRLVAVHGELHPVD